MLQRRYDQLYGEYLAHKKLLEAAELAQTKQEELIEAAEQAQQIIQSVAKITQEQLQYKVSELVSLALSSIFDDPYEFLVEFVQKRNKTECELRFVRRGVLKKPIGTSGGGAVDVASFALRLSLWTMQKPRSVPTIILDEPFRFLSPDLQEKASELLRELSDKLGMQFVIVTNEEGLLECADRVFYVVKRKGISQVIQMDS